VGGVRKWPPPLECRLSPNPQKPNTQNPIPIPIPKCCVGAAWHNTKVKSYVTALEVWLFEAGTETGNGTEVGVGLLVGWVGGFGFVCQSHIFSAHFEMLEI